MRAGDSVRRAAETRKSMNAPDIGRRLIQIPSIAAAPNERGIATAQGGCWRGASVMRLLRRALG